LSCARRSTRDEPLAWEDRRLVVADQHEAEVGVSFGWQELDELREREQRQFAADEREPWR